jgi:hypothetical protein
MALFFRKKPTENREETTRERVQFLIAYALEQLDETQGATEAMARAEWYLRQIESEARRS